MKKNKRLYLILCNFDGYIHVYATNTNKVQNFRCSNKCYCIAANDTQLFIGTDNNQLQVRSFDGNAIKSLLDGTQPVSALCLNESCLFIGTMHDSSF
ncbi:unnamed protein product [Rotaria sp. Silwood2]|nr:unnamed protein product [Rotaria sp. Silwood2]CAF4703544.1 unnamed protein product [Rotaria sp. Silwood2]